MSELLQLSNVTKSFGAVEALVDVSFSVDSGEVVALLGDNGAGKSTLIKILSGVHKHDNGKIKWQGNDIVIKSPAHARQIGFSVVYQDLAVVPLISIYRNFFLGKEELICKKILGVSFIRNNYAKNIARNALKQLGIEIENVESNVGVLSGGERQSISIARAVYFQSKLLILDEPTAALSLKETAKVLSYVQEAKKSNVGVIMITHNISHAWESADRFVVLYRGEVASILKKEETSVKEIENLINTGKK
jgi:simple sugar transport system ATP-binding protein|tara:strand:+ start:573 stop:1319 length:747 start_codon:yes stop_codon:yes gene_type:complete